MNYSITIGNLRVAMLHTNGAKVVGLDATTFDHCVVIWGVSC
jgi:hypothetical protein